MSDLKQPSPTGDLVVNPKLQQYQGQFDSLRLIVALAVCVAVIGLALYLR